MTLPRPTAAELVAAVADALEQGLTDREARVAVHTLRIVERELAAREAGPVGDEGDADLAAAIRTGAVPVDRALRDGLLRTVRARVAIDSPGYGGGPT